MLSGAVQAVDTALASTLRFARGRRLYGGTVAGFPHARAILATAHLDRQILYGVVDVDDPGTPHLVVGTAHRILQDLSVVLGARFYLRDGEHADFGEALRGLDKSLPPPSRTRRLLAESLPEKPPSRALPHHAADWTRRRSGGPATPALVDAYVLLLAADHAPNDTALTLLTRRLEGDDSPLPADLVDVLFDDLIESGTR